MKVEHEREGYRVVADVVGADNRTEWIGFATGTLTEVTAWQQSWAEDAKDGDSPSGELKIGYWRRIAEAENTMSVDVASALFELSRGGTAAPQMSPDERARLSKSFDDLLEELKWDPPKSEASFVQAMVDLLGRLERDYNVNPRDNPKRSLEALEDVQRTLRAALNRKGALDG